MCAVKKILFVYHVSSIGGGSYCLLNILKSLDRSYVKPYVLLRNDGPLVSEIRKLDIEVYFLPEMRTVPYNNSTLTISAAINAYHIIHSFKAFKDFVSKLNVDVVYLNTMMLYPYLRQVQELGKKTIIHVREHWPEDEHKWQRSQAIEHIKKYADHIVAINKYSSSMLEERAKDVVVVYDWIDMDVRDDCKPLSVIMGEETKDLKVYLYTGGLQPIKGALEIIRTFIHEVRDPNARLLALGLQQPKETSGIKGFVKRILFFLGYKTYSQQLFELVSSDKRIVCAQGTYMITSIIKQCHCYLSYFTIPHANLALAESLILNTPGVAAETAESMEYSLNGTQACLYPLNDLNGFITQIKHLNENYTSIKQQLERNSHKIKQMFDSELNIKKLNNLLQEI